MSGSDDESIRGADRRVTPERAEQWAELAGDLVLATEVVLGPTSVPDLDALRAGHRSRKRRRRATVALASLTAAAALGAVTMTVLSNRDVVVPLSYVVEGTSTVAADAIEAPLAVAADAREAALSDIGGARSTTRIRFTEGTAIALAPGARLRIPVRTAVGAELILDRGQASFAVVHRPAARWSVTVGPFTVDVTGTRFSVDWNASRKRLTLDLETGGVVVRGNAAGPGIAVHPGERLVASMLDGRVTVEPNRPARAAAGGAVPVGVTSAAAVAAAVPAPIPATAAAMATARAPLAVPQAAPARARPRGETGSLLPLPLQLAIASPDRVRARGRSEEWRSDLQPPPVVAPSAPSLVMGGGGVFCAGDHARFGFEDSDVPVSVPPFYHLAFSGPRADTTHSWCGIGSARLNVSFDERGKPNFMGRLPQQSGQLVVRLPRQMDFTDKTVSLHVYIEGPSDARVAAQLYVIHHGKWVNGPLVDHLVPRRWWTISHTFRAENPIAVGPPYPPGGTSLVTDCDRIALVVYSTGGSRTWTGAIYVDDVGWK